VSNALSANALREEPEVMRGIAPKMTGSRH
jgi:hypothetical protein